ncbi:hypothetical protein SAMN04489761_0973 [Tenacibaculum sp. MAR_2009_124]|uniref:hypothetical protein n=1 Tax=Tenacibaculum sp. MAR_2009_124 TaxID=1250059 RepID=UPI000897C142|nr:hypothetical protein [Tenacibaculum sp. MAR_2009_124]SEB48282.1 hypothetical protein SAMN04489761_0973 [Tenacibaculum sp. MAR_2009_124]
MIRSQNPDRPLFYLSKKELFQKYKRMANPIYLKSCEFFGATLIDRTHMLDSGFDFTIIDEIPVINDTKTFKEICDHRAKQVLNSTTSDLNVLWSGGIDSTLALISILKQCSSEELSRINIILSKESIKEYTTFYKEVIEGKLNHKLITGTIYEHISPSDVIITGENGDQLFGSDKLKHTVISKDAFSSYHKILDFIISRKLGSSKYTSDIIKYLEPVINKCPFEIITLYDYLWWMNFALKWQTVSMRLLYGINRNAQDLEHNVYHFFKTPSFQSWSLSNHDKKIKDTWKSYKYIAKEIIYDYHNDKEYLVNKEKEPSLKEIIRTTSSSLSWLKNIKTGYLK